MFLRHCKLRVLIQLLNQKRLHVMKIWIEIKVLNTSIGLLMIRIIHNVIFRSLRCSNSIVSELPFWCLSLMSQWKASSSGDKLITCLLRSRYHWSDESKNEGTTVISWFSSSCFSKTIGFISFIRIYTKNSFFVLIFWLGSTVLIIFASFSDWFVYLHGNLDSPNIAKWAFGVSYLVYQTLSSF